MQKGMNIVTTSLAPLSLKSPVRSNPNFQHWVMCIRFSCLDFQGPLLETEILPFVIDLYLGLFVLI